MSHQGDDFMDQISNNESQSMKLDKEDDQGLIKNMKNYDEEAVKQNLNNLHVDLIICHHLKDGKQELTEMIRRFDIAEFIEEGKGVKFHELINKLKDMGFPIEQNMIYFFSPSAEMYIYCGFDPIPEDIIIESQEYENYKNQIRIKCKESPVSYIHQTMSEEANDQIAKNKDNQPQQKDKNNGKSRRNNEKKIGFIIEKVVQWRKLYNGVKDENGSLQKYSLDDAASKVGIPKKSLDDYLLQIRFGRKYGFNFNEYKNDKVGQLRQFVRKHKQQEGGDNKKKRNNKQKKKAGQNDDKH